MVLKCACISTMREASLHRLNVQAEICFLANLTRVTKKIVRSYIRCIVTRGTFPFIRDKYAKRIHRLYMHFNIARIDIC